MGISRRMGAAISGLAFAGATALTLGAAGPAGAQTVSAAPQHSVAHYWSPTKHWTSGNWTYDYWESWDWGCGCCC
jgi:hypothetical protein